MIPMRISRFFLCFLFLLTFQQLKAQQNVLLIIADDVGPDYFGSFVPNGDTAVMPHIRSLADRGIRFTQAWASPVCSPTRAGIFTGRYPFRTGVGQVITNNMSPQLDTAEVSIARLLKTYAPLSFQTACVGKWHLHANVPGKRLNPNRMGCDYYSGNFNGAISDYYSYPIIVNGIVDTANEYATTQTINDAISWLDTINHTKPFFLWLGFNAPHSPYHLPPAHLCDTTGLTGTAAHINNNKSKYFKAALQALDSEIGRLFAYLETNGLLDSTHVIFIGDNGNAAEVAQNVLPTRCKGTIYQYGVQVPVIISGPGVVNPNRNCNNLVNTPDLFATIAELAGMSNWSSFIPVSKKVDSRSILPYIKNQNQLVSTWIFTEQFQDTTNVNDGKTIRDSEYQLLRFDNGNEEFYHLQSDPQQMTNLLTGSMSVADISHYQMLCDTLNTLLGMGSCSPAQTLDWSVNSLNLFPNPFHESIHIQIAQPIKQWILIDLQGRLFLKGENTEIETKYLPKGVYVLQLIQTDGRIKVLKCTKE